MVSQKHNYQFPFLATIFLLCGLITLVTVPARVVKGACTPGVDIGCVPPPPATEQPCQNPTGGSCVTPTQTGTGGQELFPGACVTFLGIGQFGLCPARFTFGGYLQKMYAFLLAFVAIAAFGGITYGGLLYVLSAGSVSSTDEARKWIWNALIGLFIAAISFILLRTINPDLITNFNLDLSKYAPQSSGTTGPPPASSCDPNNDQCASGSTCIPSVGGGGICRPNAITPL